MITIMPCRYATLKAVIAGYEKTGLQLVGYDGIKIFPADMSDDIGLYYFIPKVVRFFGVSLDSAINIFFYGISFAALFLGVTGFFLLTKSILFRVVSSLALCFLIFISLRGVTGIYIVQSCIVVSTIALVLYFFRKNRFTIWFACFLFFSGVCISSSHYLRSFSSVSVSLFFIIGIFFFLSIEVKKKLILFLALSIGIMFPAFQIKSVLQQQKSFFGTYCENFENGHVFWHTIYAGLGFLNNDFGLKYDDQIIINKVKENHPNVVYPTKKYEMAAKKEVFNFIRTNFSFVRNTVFAKLGIIFYFLILFANIGLIATIFYRKPLLLDFLFWLSIGFNSIFGIIAIPGRFYLLGMIAFAVLYGLTSILYAIEQGAIKDFLIFTKLNYQKK